VNKLPVRTLAEYRRNAKHPVCNQHRRSLERRTDMVRVRTDKSQDRTDGR